MTAGLKPDCFRCTRMLGVGAAGWQCEAFVQIPVDILSRQRLHTTEYEGDRGIRFQAKRTQEKAGYCAVSIDGERCDGCLHYVGEDACRLVDGTVSPVGWCPAWEQRQDAVTGLVVSDSQEGHRFARSATGSDALPAAGVMICTRDGKVLLLRRSDSGQWAFPGGGIEEGETAEQAALRECEEEIGRRPESISEWTRRRSDDVDFTTFLALVDDEFEPVLNDEHTEFKWLPVDDLASAAMHRLGLD